MLSNSNRLDVSEKNYLLEVLMDRYKKIAELAMTTSYSAHAYALESEK